MSAEEAASALVDTGISQETHSKVANELAEAQRQLAMLKAKTDIYDAQKREALTGMKDEVSTFINDIHGARSLRRTSTSSRRWRAGADRWSPATPWRPTCRLAA